MRELFSRNFVFLLAVAFGLTQPGLTQTAPLTAPQELAFVGLRAVAQAGVPAGAINAVAVGPSGALYLLVNQNDGVRLLKTDLAGSTVQAQAQIGAKGDMGVAIALDPSGDVYVTGTTSSGALTATAGAAFLSATGSAVNSFVAKFDPNLNTYFVSFAGADYMTATGIAATADAVFITGSIYSGTLPVTSAGVIQAPAYGSTGNGFVERFSASGSTLEYATYLSGAGGNTSANAIAADSLDNVYVGGYTSAPGFPTVAALVPELPGTTSGFVTKLTPAGDGITFSTYLPGTGVTSLAIDPTAGDLLVAGGISLGQFPVTAVQSPTVPLTYQVMVRMPLDGSAVLQSTAIAPGSQSFVAAGPSGTAWLDGALTLPLLPLTPLSTIGNSFAARVSSTGAVDQAVRFGGVASTNASYASGPVNLTGVVLDSAADVFVAGSFQPSASASLLATQTFDLPLESAPTAAFPTTVHGAVLPASACGGSICPGAAGYLAKVVAAASATSAALALSVDDAPNLTLRNLGSAQASGLEIAVTGFTETDNCGSALAGGGECDIALTGAGPGTVKVTALNAAAQSQSVPAITGAIAPVVVSPKELDFGIVSAAGSPVTRTVTVTNLTGQTQTFSSALSTGALVTLPYSFAEESTDCALAGDTNRSVAPGASCHVTISLTPSSDSADDGAITATWQIGSRPVALTAYGEAAALSVSATTIDFGTRYPNSPETPRYLYLSNVSSAAYSHAAVALAANSPFVVTDRCPSVLEPDTICQIELTYQPASTPSSDSVTLALDQGLSVLVTGRTVPEPDANGATVNPNLSVSPAAVSFATPVVVTGVSATTQTVTVTNTGPSAFPVAVAITGDFTETNNCSSTLAAGASCSVLIAFAPSGPGARTGLLSVAAGSNTTAVYVSLSGTGTDILSPATNGLLDLGQEPIGEPVVAWYKVTQAFTTFTASVASATAGSPFSVVLVEDVGYGHGQPQPSAYSTSGTGTCVNCWIGVRFDPAVAGVQTGTLSLSSTSGGSPYLLTLIGTGEPLEGLLLSPTQQDFGPIAVNSTSGGTLFTVTNLSAGAGTITLGSPVATGDFVITGGTGGGPACGGALAFGASCYIEVEFAPGTTGPATGTLTVTGGGSSAVATLTGYGEADPGIAVTPAALVFSNVPGGAATEQTVTVKNTGASTVAIGQPQVTTTAGTGSFGATTNCSSLAAGASCEVTVSFTPGDAQAAGTLTVPVTTYPGGAPEVTSYTVALTGGYTVEDAGLEILPGDVEYGPLATGSISWVRQFQVNNLTGKPLTLDLALPRQYALSGTACSGLAAGASCTFSVEFVPLTNGEITGTIFATGTPSDGTGTVNGLAYMDGYGQGSGVLTITGNMVRSGVLNFGSVPSGQSEPQTLTLTNSSSTATLTIRRVTSEWPFPSTTTCGSTLAPGASCTATVTYTPLDQVAIGGSLAPSSTDTGTLMIESDAGSSPDIVDLKGMTSPVAVSTPSNTAPVVAFTVSPSSLSFVSTQAGNASAPQTVVLSNTGTEPVHVLGLQTSPDYTLNSQCGTILPGSSCDIDVTFTPQPGAQGSSVSPVRSSAIEISSDAVTSLEFVSVLGSTTPSVLQLSQTELNFGTVQVGSSGGLDLQVTNTGANAVTFGAISASGDYTAGAGSCPLPGAALAGGTSCAIHITFAPTATGTRSGTLNIASSASTLPLDVALTGTGVQSHLAISPAALDFGEVAVGSSANLSITLANTGSAPVTGVTLSVTAGYAVTVPCAVTTLAPGASCSVTVTFSPSAIGSDPGTLGIVSSDSSSPATLPLSGTGVTDGTFTLTVNGGSSASATVRPYGPANYTLTVTPVNGFAGQVLLTCTPLNPGEYVSCSLLPSTVALNGAAQNASVTLQTVASIGRLDPPGPTDATGRSFRQTALALLFPALLLSWKARTSDRRRWRRVVPIAWAFLAMAALLTSSGCGSGPVSNLRFASPGTYQYQVTATSVGTDIEVTRTVTLNLTVTN